MSEPRLSVIPAAAATDPEIKPRDLQLLCVLGRHTDKGGWCRRSQVKMAAEMGCARSTVFSAVERLVKRGYLERHLVETDSGRDSAHLYRVVLDPVIANLSAVQAEETMEENGAGDPCRYIGTPAGISAPPAGPEPAPPAGPEPAPPAGPEPAPPAGPEPAPSITTPLNDPSLTKRESAGADGPEEDCSTASRDTWKRRFRKAHAEWPTYASDSADRAEAEWFALSEEDRTAAADLLQAYVRHVRGTGRKAFCAFGVYLHDRLWTRLPPALVSKGGALEVAAPFGKLWSAVRFADLMRPPYGKPPVVTVTEEELIGRGLYTRERLLRDKRANTGWPRVNDMQDHARRGRGVTVPPELEPFGNLFEMIRKGSDLWHAWKDLHAERGWPWFAPDCPEWVGLPAAPEDPATYNSPLEAARAALARFETEHATIDRKDAAE
jgi:hypothetical protein